MEQNEVTDRLRRACALMIARHARLFEYDVSERAVVAQLLQFVSAEFPDFDVDTEYNRSGERIKQIPRVPGKKDSNPIRVFPDLIVHQRGSNDRNLVVCEVKKGSSRSMQQADDREKLASIRDEYGYTFAIQIILPCSTGASVNETQIKVLDG